ncbi:LysR family transcriptional regulator [Magnetospira sp. QH-2]|uniref:LysR family transcriptional regulator n=1 Tax=Magnetospira sp. (strain QH-2) TaxID=1288970 RepID=UPI0003E80C9D|nr:LysR family transcriptional regulator [Magnetospira sp. QH-2]CCQ73222.1 Putative LysR family transcriptional regulatory protein [Magnetospira sp. QH-2]
MDRLLQMHLFVRLVEARSFSAVAQERNLSQSTVSKQMAALEGHLGARLLNRSTRRISLTEEGASYYEKCRTILESVAEAEAGVSGAAASPTGTLRLACPLSFGARRIAPLLPSILKDSPDFSIELVMSDRSIDLVEEGVDLAIRIGPLADSALMVQRIGTTWRELVASAEYLQQMREPKDLNDLSGHNCLINTGFSSPDHWHFMVGEDLRSVPVQGTVRANNSGALRECALAGVGIGLIPIWQVEEDLRLGRLQRVLPSLSPAPLPIHALYPRGGFVPAKVRLTLDRLKKAFRR